MTGQFQRESPFSYACDHYMDTVYRVAVHNAPSPEDAEDVTQEVFERLLTCRKGFADEEHLKAWLIRCTLNRCKNLFRNRREVALSEALPAPEREEGSVMEEVRRLPERYRNAIYLHYFEGYTAAEIAQIMGGTTSTALSWLRRGREALRKRMIGGFDDE